MKRTFASMINGEEFIIHHDDRREDDMGDPFHFTIEQCREHYFSNMGLPSVLFNRREITANEYGNDGRGRMRRRTNTYYISAINDKISERVGDLIHTFSNTSRIPGVWMEIMENGKPDAIVDYCSYDINSGLKSIKDSYDRQSPPESLLQFLPQFTGFAGGLNHRHTKLMSKRNKPIKIYTKNKNNNKIKTRKLKGKKRTLKKRRNKTNKRNK
jgi:hypothetical protein